MHARRLASALLRNQLPSRPAITCIRSVQVHKVLHVQCAACSRLITSRCALVCSVLGRHTQRCIPAKSPHTSVKKTSQLSSASSLRRSRESSLVNAYPILSGGGRLVFDTITLMKVSKLTDEPTPPRLAMMATIGKFPQDGLSGVAWGQQWRELLTLEVLLSSVYCCARVGRRRARRNPTPRRDRDALRCLVFIFSIILVFIL